MKDSRCTYAMEGASTCSKLVCSIFGSFTMRLSQHETELCKGLLMVLESAFPSWGKLGVVKRVLAVKQYERVSW